ncbi:UBX domain-containing protein 4 isoform X2 [Ornithorhynchus anatinus]|nr:UBX domain-containing protein 4 isoform X2 [Ornithorhynchus anatinus]
MAARWEEEKVAEASADSFIAIKIDTQSEACLQFSQIYPVVCVPSSFFIGDSGIPLEVIAGSVTAEELISRIHKVTRMHRLKNEATVVADGQLTDSMSPPASSDGPTGVKENPQAPSEEHCEPSTSVTIKQEATSVTIKQEATSVTIKQEVSLSGDTSGSASPSQEAQVQSQESGMGRPPADDLTDKVERITKKLEERREEKRKEEEQKEIQKEIDRRKTGKEMLDYKRKQEEELTKRLLEERSREKAEDKAARERIKRQIAMDRAERAARFAKTKEEVEAAKAAALQARQAEMEAKKEPPPRERSAVARIQFRLPDGSSFTNQFPATAPLENVRQFAAQTVGTIYGNFSLATMFPRREFTQEDYGRNLSDLELAPSASVVLVPAGRTAVATSTSTGGDLWAFLGTILYPLIAVWRIISNFLFASPPPAQAAARPAPQMAAPSAPAVASGSDPREAVRRRVPDKHGEDFKKEGKVYRLRTQDDGEDENNTWNGNSTQQM